MAAQRAPKRPPGAQKGPQRAPKVSQRTPKESQKASQSDHQAQKKVDTVSKLRFAGIYSVFEPPKLKVDYPYYVFGTLGKLFFPKCHENIVNTMLLELPKKPVLAMNGKRVSMRRVC